MTLQHYFNNIDLNYCNFNYSHILNESKYEILESLQYDLNTPKLYPFISLYSITKKLSENFKKIDNINLIVNNNNINRIPFTKLRLLSLFLENRSEINILKKIEFSNNSKYIVGKGMIRDEQQNTLICICFDITKVDFAELTNNKILEGGLYLMIDIKRLSNLENKKLLSIINSKGSIINMCLEQNIDIIYTSKIDRKLFTTFNKEFTSITDRKIYLQEKAKLLMEQDIENVVIQ